jgi:CHAD domain-containing protein
VPTLERTSRRASRALERLATEHPARAAVGAAAAGAAAAGVAAAGRAVADRLRPDDDGGPSRAYRLKRKEKPAEGIRRIGAGRADSALAHLESADSGSVAEPVHEARKDLKKLRSALRLARPHLDEATYARENDRFRGVGRALGGARDAEVKLETLRLLAARYEDDFPAEACEPLSSALAEDRDRLTKELKDDESGTRQWAAEELRAGRTIAGEWPIDADGWELIEPGLRRSYRRGRNRFNEVREDPSPTAVHEWRKRVKDLWYHLRVVRDAWPEVIGELSDQTHKLADLLGDHHDLTVLAEEVASRRDLLTASDRRRVQSLIKRRQKELLVPALRLGTRIYADKPKHFTRRMGEYWHAWRPDGVRAATPAHA